MLVCEGGGGGFLFYVFIFYFLPEQKKKEEKKKKKKKRKKKKKNKVRTQRAKFGPARRERSRTRRAVRAARPHVRTRGFRSLRGRGGCGGGCGTRKPAAATNPGWW
jgi:outer membrane biosynthesis protein TonB